MATMQKTNPALDSLEKDIRRLQAKAKKLEDQIDDNFTYLQDHSASLFINSLFPGKSRRRSESDEGLAQGGLLYAFLQNERLQGTLNRLLTRLTERASKLINKLIDNWID